MALASKIEVARLTPDSRDEIRKLLVDVEPFYSHKAPDAYLFLNMLGQVQGTESNQEARKKFFAEKFATGTVTQKLGILLYEESDFLAFVEPSEQERILNDLIQLNAVSPEGYLPTALAVACEKVHETLRLKLINGGHCGANQASEGNAQE